MINFFKSIIFLSVALLLSQCVNDPTKDWEPVEIFIGAPVLTENQLK